ncbi:HTH_Tnp_Tc3_2 domain-containing protein [Trichonephila clavipes]|nr:HTH_Tnp_Tc3_2 domain-containing protein [Trichonephila clavipes]
MVSEVEETVRNRMEFDQDCMEGVIKYLHCYAAKHLVRNDQYVDGQCHGAIENHFGAIDVRSEQRDVPLFVRVVGRLEEGQTQAAVAQAMGVSQSVISRIWNRFLETGSAGRRPGQVRRRATTSNENRYLVLTARRHRNMNVTLLQQHFRSATGTTVSTQTVETGSMV